MAGERFPLDGRKLRELRGIQDVSDPKTGKRRYMTQVELANLVGVDVDTISNWERGVRKPSWAMAGRLTEELKLDNIDELRGNTAVNAVYDEPSAVTSNLICFDAFIEDRRKGFHGRDHIFNQIDDFLVDSQYKSGVLLIQGDPGIGKSALMAEFVRRRQLTVYHFIMALSTINKRRHFLGNICARLIESCVLEYRVLPDDYDRDGRVLMRLLEQAAQSHDQKNPLIIVVDALDELENADGHPNPLLLPEALPDGVFFIISSRIRSNVGLGGQVHRIVIDPSHSYNKLDIREYIEIQPKGKDTIAWMKKRGLSDADFTDLLSTISEGNFMYLKHVLPEINNGGFQNDSVEEMPVGLISYYQQHWKNMERLAGGIREVSEPVLCTIAAARSPLLATKIASVTGVDLVDVHKCIHAWREFLHKYGPTSPSDNEPVYGLYHLEFARFLESEVAPGLHKYHASIARAARKNLPPRQEVE